MPERRGSPRVAVSLDCVLRRRTGSDIAARTVDVGPGGMSVSTTRPLSTDEVLHFDLPLQGATMDGEARVLREQGYRVYALRFESIAEQARSELARMAG